MIPGNDKAVSIRIAANFTVEPIEEFLAYWIAELGIPAEIRFAPYNQVFQQLLEGGLLRSNRGGINLLALDLDAWFTGSADEARARLETTLADLMAALRAAGALGAGGAVLLFPPAAGQDEDRTAVVASARAMVLAECAGVPGWGAVDLAAAAELYSVAETRDPFTDELGNIPFTEEMYATAATAAARRIRAACTRARKVIVLDCDNTLWAGICGEGAIHVTEPYRRLQEFMLAQQESGVLLALASKNNEADVMAVLESGASLLRPEHFTAWRINWQPKSESIQALSEELGLALDSFIFIDDSSYECMEVANQCPQVLTIQLPAGVDQIPEFLQHFWAFDRPATTGEDRNRTQMYQAERQRAELGRRAMTPEEFLASLRLEIGIAPAAEADLARVAQLTHRTTQFNMTGVLHNEQSLSSLLAADRYCCRTVRVQDAFGDYGLVGVLLCEICPDALRVENFLLSCRALGRRVEDRMVQELRSLAVERGLDRIIIPVVPTARNLPAREFLHRLCGAPPDSSVPFACELSASGMDSEWRPLPIADHTAVSASAVPMAAPPAAAEEQATLTRIAHQVRTAAAMIAATRTVVKRRPASAVPIVSPRNPTEVALARIWSECLATEPIGVKDNFFDFGGHSLLATRILARARSEFGVEIGLTKFFEAPTVEGMATCIANAPQAAAVAR
jgi:FkbH-like protein